MLLYEKISASYLACTGQEQGTAVKSPSLISSSLLTQVCVLFGVFLAQAMGMDESGSLLSSAFPFQTLTSLEAAF